MDRDAAEIRSVPRRRDEQVDAIVAIDLGEAHHHRIRTGRVVDSIGERRRRRPPTSALTAAARTVGYDDPSVQTRSSSEEMSGGSFGAVAAVNPELPGIGHRSSTLPTSG